MTTFLDRLLADARRRVAEDRGRIADDVIAKMADEAPDPPSLYDALAAPGVGIIAEIKRASPSKGDLAPDLDALTHGSAYRDGGAAAISVLTEPDRFKGTLDDLRAVATLGVPTLRKDFTVDRYQILEARSAGASAILLIVAALDDTDLRDLHAVAVDAGLTALVEVHDEQELARAVDLGARVVGVNARDLRTFDIDRDAFERLRPSFPDGVVSVAESGIRGPDDVVRAAAAGADAVLVGETLVTGNHPRDQVAAMVAAGRRDQPD